MSISDASIGHHGHCTRHRPNRKGRLGTLAVVADCLVVGDRNGRSDDADDEEIVGPSVTNTIGMKLAWIPAGEFLMGSPNGDEPNYGNEQPRHRVRITRPFRLGVHEVTKGEWTDVMGTTPWKPHGKEGNRYPATYVNSEDAMEFCRKLTEKERAAGWLKVREAYRLLTEAEWEYACRAGSETRYHFGDGEGSLGEYAWYEKNAGEINERYAHSVGLKRPNAWGLFDMHGNVWELCSDWYGEKYYGKSPRADPLGPSKGTSHVSRGGSWLDMPHVCRSAHRIRFEPEPRFGLLGFRVVRTIAPSK